jgi:hypothetical protein
MPDADWKELYKAAVFELNPDKLIICIQTAQQAITQAESRLDIPPAERNKLADARSMLMTLSRLASSQAGRAA